MITYQELLATPEYWTTKIQLDLYTMLKNYIVTNHLTRAELASRLGVTKGYFSQVMNGDFDHRLSKLVELSLAVGMVPQVSYIPMDKVFAKETASAITIEKIIEENVLDSSQMKSFVDDESLRFSKLEENIEYRQTSYLLNAA